MGIDRRRGVTSTGPERYPGEMSDYRTDGAEGDTTVTVTHVPTGVKATCGKWDLRYINRNECVVLIRTTKEFRRWERRIGNRAT